MESWIYKPKVTNAWVDYLPTYCTDGHERLVKNINYDYNICDPVKYWCCRSKHEIDLDCDEIKIDILKPILFERIQEDSGISLHELQNIEIMEQFIELVKSVSDIPCFIRGILTITDNNDFKKWSAVNWVESTGNVKATQTLQVLGQSGFTILKDVFDKFKVLIEGMAYDLMNVKESAEFAMCPSCIKKSDLFKAKGNEEFAKEHFELAAKSYSKAIDCYPENHLLYGNRALCYLRLAQFPQALADGKRATILKQKWFKGHHRFCDALFAIGKHEQALEANIKAQKLCENDPQGMKELIQQNLKIRTDIDLIKGAASTDSVFRFKGQNPLNPEPGPPTSPLNRSRKEGMNKRPNLFAESCNKMDNKECTMTADIQISKLGSESSTVNSKANNVNESKGKRSDGKFKMASDSKSRVPEKLKDEQKNHNSNSSSTFSPIMLNKLREMLKVHVYNGHRALLDQCFYNAKQAFSTLLDVLDPLQLEKQNVSTMDYVLLIYGHASALLGIGKPEELMMAEQQLNKIIENYTKQRFNCLAFYGIGNVYLRQNRFAEAINRFNDSKLLLNQNVVPGVLKWPTTSVVIEETCPEKLLVLLEKSIEECRFPPKPDAICRFLLCQGYIKKQIYFTDPDFEGFVRLLCSHKCKIEFHINCWTKQKAVLSSDMDDVPDLIKNICFSPDCTGTISSVDIYSSSGLVQSPFEENISKDKGLEKPPFTEENTEVYKLAAKQEHKLRKMYLRKEKLCFTQEIKDVTPKEENFSNEVKENTQMKICVADPVLLHVMENAELIRKGVLDTGLLMSNLLLWDVIGEEDHRKYFASIPCSLQDEVMGTLINLVAKKRSKVKIRVFLHVLNSLPKVDTKLHDWLTEINNIGLRAAPSFLSWYADCLQKIDLGLVHKLWNETYGIKLKSLITSNTKEVVVEYFHQASPEKARCLIWLLEENKEKFQDPALYQALDSYFTVMDSPINMLGKKEKQDVSTNGTKVKNKKRKKKQRNPETPVVLPPDVGTVAQEGSNIATNENKSLIKDSSAPCAALEKVCEQVREWESSYYCISRIALSLGITEEGAEGLRDLLYKYYVSVFDVYGPLDVDGDILLGGYNSLPLKAQQFLEEAGGIKSFLLASILFRMFDSNKIGLSAHAARKPTGDTLKVGAETEIKTVCADFPTVLSGANSNTCENISTAIAKNIFNSSVYSEQVLFSCEVPVSSLNPAPSEYTNDCKPAIAIQPKFNVDSSSPNHGIGALTTNTVSATKTVTSSSLKKQEEFYDGHKTSTSLNVSVSSLKSTNLAANSIKKKQKMKPEKKALHRMEDISQMKKEPCEQQKQLKEVSKESELSMSRNTDTICVVEKQSQTEENKEDLLQFEKLPHVQQKHPKEAFVKSELSVFVMEKQSQTEAIKFSDHHANTDPFHPFEKKQGDILRMEKEHCVLQRKLKEASDKYELSRTKKTDEINVVEGELKTITEENKVAKTELDWFYKDLENEVKKWQQEKKEHQERIRSIKNNIKKLMDNNETCVKSIQEKKQLYQKMLNEFLESSNRFENEKMKLEDIITKGKDQILECSKRAFASEESSLENQKNIETYKMRLAISSGKTKLNFLCSMENSVPASALPQFKSHIMAWNTYLASISNEIENVVSQFEERIDLVRSGAKSKSLQPVLVEMPPSPPTIPVELLGWNPVVQCKGQSAPNAFIGLVGYEKEQGHDVVTVDGTNNSSVSSKHPTPLTYPWKSVTSNSSWRNSKDSACVEEDPCIICHEELYQHTAYVLECGHRFHKLCIHTWLNTQSTCPTCRVHVLLNEEFPALTSRKRPT